MTRTRIWYVWWAAALSVLLVACKGAEAVSTSRIQNCGNDPAGWRHIPPAPAPDGQPQSIGRASVTWTGHVAYLRDGNRAGLVLDPANGNLHPMGVEGLPDNVGPFSPVHVWTGKVALYGNGKDLVQYGGSWSLLAPNPGAQSVDPIAYAWTGSRLLVWLWDQIGSYDPAADTWTAGNMTGAPALTPSSAEAHGVWTGKELVVWSTGDATGGRYNPATDSWRAMSSDGAPTHNVRDFTLAWVDPYVVVWGGGEGGQTQPDVPAPNGGRYDVEHDQWLPISTEGAPPARVGQLATSTGKHLVVFGGTDDVTGPHSDAYRYDPATDHWETLSSACLDPQVKGTALGWLGKQLLVWGFPPATAPDFPPGQGWLLPLSP